VVKDQLVCVKYSCPNDDGDDDDDDDNNNDHNNNNNNNNNNERTLILLSSSILALYTESDRRCTEHLSRIHVTCTQTALNINGLFCKFPYHAYDSFSDAAIVYRRFHKLPFLTHADPSVIKQHNFSTIRPYIALIVADFSTRPVDAQRATSF
jgi:hypothetical protein